MDHRRGFPPKSLCVRPPTFYDHRNTLKKDGPDEQIVESVGASKRWVMEVHNTLCLQEGRKLSMGDSVEGSIFDHMRGLMLPL